MNAEELRIVDISGRTSYFGTVEETENGNIVVVGVEVSDIKLGMERYIKAKNLDELRTFTFRGKGNYSERNMTSDEEIRWNHIVAIFKDVEKKAQKIVVNDMFDQALKQQ